MLMAQETPSLGTTEVASDVSQPVKPLSQTLRPHYFTIFQKTCCIDDAKAKSATDNRNVLPIPQKFRDETKSFVKSINSYLIENLSELSKYTSRIPEDIFTPLDKCHPDRYLIDRPLLRIMEEAHVINWMPSVAKLYPIRTSGNGNCLLHAVLIAIAGVHDVDLYLRDRLVQFMNENKEILGNYWRNERLESDKKYGIRSEEAKLDTEWEEVRDLARYENSEDGQVATQLRFLEAIHIFSISNVLQRPIIVLSEKYIRNLDGEAVSVNDLFGIYLPILLTSDECCREPIVLAYHQFHFCPLQSSRPTRGPEIFEQQLPLYPSINDTYDQKLLPTRFLGNDVTKEDSRELLAKYLNISELPYSFDAGSAPLKIQCAALGTKSLVKRDDFLLLYCDYCKDFSDLHLPNALAEEKRQADKQRQLDYLRDSRPLYDPVRRQVTTTVSLPPLNMPSRSFVRLNERSQPREQGLPAIDPMSTDGYTPRTGGVLVSNHQAPTDALSTLPDPATAAPSGSQSDFLYSEGKKSTPAMVDAENISNPQLREKDSNRPSTLPTSTGYRDAPEQSQNYREIKIEVVGKPLSSSNSNASDFDPQSHLRGRCLDCHRSLSDSSSVSLCSFCLNDRYYLDRVYETNSRPLTSRSPRRDEYSPLSYASYVDDSLPKTTPRAHRLIYCPKCRNPNRLSGVSTYSNYYCSACSTLLSTGAAYR